MREIKVRLTGYWVVRADHETLAKARSGELEEFPYGSEAIGLYPTLEEAQKLGYQKGGNLVFLLKGESAELVAVKETATIILPIEDGTIEHLNYESHRRGTNWVAKVSRNQTKPNGLEREFLKLIRSGQRAVVVDEKTGQLLLESGDYLEFGGDYYTAGGRRKASRRYYRVLRIEGGEIELEEISKDSI